MFIEYQTEPGGDIEKKEEKEKMLEKMNDIDEKLSHMTDHRNVTRLHDMVGHTIERRLVLLQLEEDDDSGQVKQLELDATVEGREDAMNEVISLTTTHTASGKQANLATIVLPLNNTDSHRQDLLVAEKLQQHQQPHDQTGNVKLLSELVPTTTTTTTVREEERLATKEQRTRREEAGHQTIEAGDDTNNEKLSELAVQVPLLETSPRLLLLFTVRRLQIVACCCCCPDQHCQGQHCCHTSTRFLLPSVDNFINRTNVLSNKHYHRQQQHQQSVIKAEEECLIAIAGIDHPIETSQQEQDQQNSHSINIQTKLECQLANICCCKQRLVMIEMITKIIGLLFLKTSFAFLR